MCTSLNLKSKDNLYLHARTMDFSFELDPIMAFIPRNYELSFLYHKFHEKHLAFMGLCKFLDSYTFADGINEAGLSGASLYFPDYAHYSKKELDGMINLTPQEVIAWILAHCKDVDEVRKEFTKINIVESIAKKLDVVVPLHWIFCDASGDSIIVEPMEDGLKIMDNKVGVLTNSPDYNWHLTNIRNYISLDPNQVKSRYINGVEFKPFGQGSGTFGLPGDLTPPSRFVKTLFNRLSSVEVSGEAELVLAAQHILNSVDIPKGSVITSYKGLDYTQYTVYMVNQTKSYYFRMYDSSRIIRVTLDDFDINGLDIVLIEPPAGYITNLKEIEHK